MQYYPILAMNKSEQLKRQAVAITTAKRLHIIRPSGRIIQSTAITPQAKIAEDKKIQTAKPFVRNHVTQNVTTHTYRTLTTQETSKFVGHLIDSYNTQQHSLIFNFWNLHLIWKSYHENLLATKPQNNSTSPQNLTSMTESKFIDNHQVISYVVDNRLNKVNKKRQKSLKGYRKPPYEGKIRNEDEKHVIIEDPSNHLYIKVDKRLPKKDISKILKMARTVSYAKRVKIWFNMPETAFDTTYRSECQKNGIKPKEQIPIDECSKMKDKSYAMHRFSKLVDQLLCYGNLINNSDGFYRIVINGKVADLAKTKWKPCIFEYVFDKHTNICFHRNMKILGSQF